MTRPMIEGDAHRSTNLSLSAAIVAFVNAVLSAIINFGIPLSSAQQASITSVVNAAIILVLACVHLYGQITAEHDRWSHMDGIEE